MYWFGVRRRDLVLRWVSVFPKSVRYGSRTFPIQLRERKHAISVLSARLVKGAQSYLWYAYRSDIRKTPWAFLTLYKPPYLYHYSLSEKRVIQRIKLPRLAQDMGVGKSAIWLDARHEHLLFRLGRQRKVHGRWEVTLVDFDIKTRKLLETTIHPWSGGGGGMIRYVRSRGELFYIRWLQGVTIALYVVHLRNGAFESSGSKRLFANLPHHAAMHSVDYISRGGRYVVFRGVYQRSRTNLGTPLYLGNLRTGAVVTIPEIGLEKRNSAIFCGFISPHGHRLILDVVGNQKVWYWLVRVSGQVLNRLNRGPAGLVRMPRVAVHK